MARLRSSGIIASASVLALVLAPLCLATVSLADDPGDGVLEQPPGAPPPSENASASSREAPSKDLDALRVRLTAQNMELGEQGARLSVSQAALRDQALRADILACIAVALLGAVLALAWQARRGAPSTSRPERKPRRAERAKGPRRPSSIEPHDLALPRL